MFAAGIAFLLGACAALLAPAPEFTIAIAALLACIALAALQRPRRGARALALVLLAGAAGGGWTALHGALRLAAALPAALQGRDLTIEGQVVDQVRRRGDSVRFTFALDAPAAGLARGARLRLGWYGRLPAPGGGERWRLAVRLKQPHGLRNPGSFDYETWLFRHNVRALGYVRQGSANRRLARAEAAPLLTLRLSIAARIAAGDYRQGVLLGALLTGLRADMAPGQWQVLRATGTAHLFAISGLHIGLAALFGHLLGGLAWRLLASRAPRLQARQVTALGALLCAAAYAALAGFSVPTERALAMLCVLLGARLAGCTLAPAAALGGALVAVLLLDPWAPLAAGFWLSFGAVAAIAWLLCGRWRPSRWLPAFLRVQAGLALLLAPLTLLSFAQTPLTGALANLLAVPLVSFIVVPCALGGLLLAPLLPLADSPLLWLADRSLDLLWRALVPLAQWPLAEWQPPGLTPATLVLAGLAVLLLSAPRLVLPRWLALAMLLPLIAPTPQRPPPGTAIVTVLDAGQGLAAVVETHSRVLVYDTGAAFSPAFDIGSAVLAPFLRARGWRAVDRLVVSHADRDHAGGAAGLAAALPLREVITSAPGALPGLEARACRRGERWHWDGVQFELLHPPPAGAGGSRNDRSCVLRVLTGRHAALLPGDIERAGEQALLATPATVRADLLVVPHHGSATSSTSSFVRAVAPRYAVVPAGFRNRFGFPHPQVCARLREVGATPLLTASEGALQFRLSAQGVSAPRRYRRESRRFWHRAPAPHRCTTR